MAESGGGRAGVLGAVVVVLVVAIVVVSIASAGGSGWNPGPPFDPDATDEDGLRGLVLLYEQAGIDVRVVAAAPRGFRGVVLAVGADIDEDRGLGLVAAARRGATVVVAGTAEGVGAAPRDRIASGVDPRACEWPSLGAVEELDVGLTTFEVVEGDRVCLVTDRGPALVSRSTGEGELVFFGGPGALINGNLDRADHAAVALGLVAGADEVAVLRARVAGSGDSTLMELLPDGVVVFLAQLVVVAAVEMLRRSRRLGRPVAEGDVVELDGVEMVRSTARLLHKIDDRSDALGVIARSGGRESPPAADRRGDADFVAVAASLAPNRDDAVHEEAHV